MNLQQIKYVFVLNKCKNFNKAATELYITQPTLSQQIKALEEELGVALFLRSKKEVVLTDAGQYFLNSAKTILFELDGIEKAMAEFRNQNKGLIRIGVLPAFSYLNIMDYIKEFKDAYPGIDIKMHVDCTLNLLKGLEEHLYDAVFITRVQDSKVEDDLIYKTISNSDIVLMSKKSSHLANKEVVKIEDLDKVNLITPPYGSPVRQELNRYFNIYKTRPFIVCESSNVDTIFRCVKDGLGSAIIEKSLGMSLANKEIIIQKLDPEIRREVCFAIHKEGNKTKSLKVFADFIDNKINLEKK